MHTQTLQSLLKADPLRWKALQTLQKLELPQGMIAAGFLRNLVWDYLHQIQTPLQDIDVVYYDESQSSAAVDTALESQLKAALDLPWSVKNQARMHLRNQEAPYTSVEDAMRYWPERETALGAALNTQGQLKLTAPFGLEGLFALKLTPHPHKKVLFWERLQEKQWLRQWPQLQVVEEDGSSSSESACSGRRQAKTKSSSKER